MLKSNLNEIKVSDLKINYSQCWEDSELVLKALDINSEDVVVSIISGGCNTLRIASLNPAKVYAVDFNRAQVYLFQLKLYAAIKLEYSHFLEFMGAKPSYNRFVFYKALISNLSTDCVDFWKKNKSKIKNGIIHSGKFERYINFFRRFFLPRIHSKSIINDFFNIKSKDEQKSFFMNIWNNKPWRMMFAVFYGRQVMQRIGRKKEMFHYSKKVSAGSIFLQRFSNGLAEGNIQNNHYLEYLLTGSYERYFPQYLQKENIDNIRKKYDIDIVCKDLFDFLRTLPDNSVTKFNLSDIFEPLPLWKTDLIFDEILRVSKNNARIILWNNLVERNAPKEYSKFMIRETELENNLKQNDRIFFYDKFLIYTIKK